MSPRPHPNASSILPTALSGAIRTALLATVLVTATAVLPAAAQTRSADAAIDQVRRYDIPAGPLDAALNGFARASGLNLHWSREQVAALTTQGLKGEHDARRGLNVLLAGTGLAVQFDASGHGVRLEKAPAVEDGVTLTAPLNVEGATGGVSGYQGQTTYDAAAIAAVPSRKGHITSLLRMHPGVQFDNEADSSRMPGDLEPADISIHGAKFWQNLFLVDGLSVNNDINPGDRTWNNVNGSLTDLPGNKSQGIALDTALLERVDVYDSNVPAEYGGFNGGVVDAVIRKPSEEFHGSLSVTSTRDAWTSYHLDPAYADSFYNNPALANGLGRTQPEFKTMIYRLNLEGALTDSFRLLGSFTRKQSDIYNQRVVNATNASAGYTLDEYTDVTRRFDDYLLKGVWQPNERLDVEVLLAHQPQESEYFNINAMDGDFVMESGGTQAGVTLTWHGDNIEWTHRFSGSWLDHSRTGGPGWYQSWYYSPEKNWGNPALRTSYASLYGTFGDIEQGQDRVGYDLKAQWKPFQALGMEHRIAFGASVSRTEAWYERKEDFTFGNRWAGTKTCTDANGVVDDRHCSTSPVTYLPTGWQVGDGQMATRLLLYKAGRFEVEQTAWSAWVEDAVQLGRLNLRAGLRVDGDDYMDRETVAPRFAADYDLFGDGATRLVAGANRYYGRNVFDYLLREGRQLLQYTQERDTSTLLWADPVRNALNTTVFNTLDIPYDDELMAGIRQIAWGTEFELKYVHREGRDQIIRQTVRGAYPDDALVNQTSHYEYLNAGRSKNETVSLTVTPQRAFAFAGTSTTGQLVANWTDARSSHSNYNSSYDEALDNSIIRYEGDFIRYSERPADNYNRPWTARISTTTTIPAWNLTVGNYLSWRGPYAPVVLTGETVEYQGEQVDVYERRRYGTNMSWDLRFAWEQPLAGQQAFFANLDITNLLDRVNTTAVLSTSEIVYEVGRQFQLELGYRF